MILHSFAPTIISNNALDINSFKILKKILVVLVSFLVFGGYSTPVIADLGKDDRAAMHDVIEQYIRDNPEVLRDALLELSRREEQARIVSGLAKVRLDDGDPVIGNLNGNLVVYEFSDYNCGYCKRLFPTIQKILANNEYIRVVVKEFPILGKSSIIAARAGIAAQKQDKFPSFHSEMMNYRGQVSDASIMAAARAAGLDLNQLRQDMDSTATTAIIERTQAGAAALNLKGTPALVIGETVIPGAVSIEELQRVIDLERAKQG